MRINNKLGSILIILLMVFGGANAQSVVRKDASADNSKIAGIISKMKLEQKAQLVIGTGMFFEMPDSIKAKMPPGFGGDVNTKDPVYNEMVKRIRKYLPGAAGVSSEFPELGIASQVLTDGPAGLRIQPMHKGETKTYYCTAFPIATVLASTWDTELVYNVGKAMGNEVKEYGSDIILGPALNIQRDPLCGRNFEYYSEDPLIAGKTAAAMVKGIQSNGVGTSIKHFAANNSETNRITVNTIVSERALREIYLRGFEIAVKEAQPWTVMSSYNKINGTYTSESNDLLTKILRNDWGFEGYVMTDWGGGSDVVAQMNAGNDMIQPGQTKQIDQIIEAVKGGKLDEKILDRNISRILKIMMIAPRYNKYKYSSTPDLTAHAAVTRQAATDGMVLLENKGNTLPIKAGVKNIAAFGNTSYDFIAGGTGSGDVNEAYTISLFEGLTNGGYTPDAQLTDTYNSYVKDAKAKQGKPKNPIAAMMGGKEPVSEMIVSPELAKTMAEKSDMALITIGRNAGEGQDRTDTEGDFRLTVTEKEMMKNVTEAFHAQGKKAIVVMNVAGVVEVASWRDMPDAILVAWQPGQEGGNSVVDVLSGKVNPSGKLAVTFPMTYADAPSAKNFPGVAEKSDKIDKAADLSEFSFMRRTPWEMVYEDYIYVGYRYYNTFKVPVAYEFGYGLSYTAFTYSNLKLSTTDFKGQLTATVEVKNSGKVAGREVVQLYIGAPSGKLNKPAEILAAYGKTKLLKPGESQTLSFKIETRDFASFNEATSTWIAEAGTYNLKIGASSLTIKQTANFKIAKELEAGKVTKALAPTREINKLVWK
ncbi:MAG TPA: glycoside hydrolase family 3 N-terminal domain-containing protein [Prolixibacteraceae bacterium]|nr:glycoside hydrolase family 3 N-terminal domain-containing protein [Prolixibacteraceae bacterium]